MPNEQQVTGMGIVGDVRISVLQGAATKTIHEHNTWQAGVANPCAAHRVLLEHIQELAPGRLNKLRLHRPRLFKNHRWHALLSGGPAGSIGLEATSDSSAGRLHPSC